MKSKSFIIPFCLFAFFITNCAPENAPNIYTYRQRYLGFGAYEKCCDLPSGNDCAQVDHYIDFDDFMRFRTYLEKDSIASYFINENWGSLFPMLSKESDIVNQIIHTNPKGVIDGAILHLLLDRNKPVSEENNLFSVFFIPNGKATHTPCHGSFLNSN